MIRPRRSCSANAARMWGVTSWHIRARPKTFTSNCRRASEIGTSSTAP